MKTLITLFSLMFVVQIGIAQNGSMTYVATRSIKFSAEPSGKALFKVPKGDSISILGIERDNYLAEYKGQKGYVNEFYINSSFEKRYKEELKLLSGGEVAELGELFYVKKDDFTGEMKIFQKEGLLLHQSGYKTLVLTFKGIDDKVIIKASFSNSDFTSMCINDDSKIMFKFDDGEVKELSNINGIDCDKMPTLANYIEKDLLKKMVDNNLVKVRCVTTEGYIDFEVINSVPKNAMNKQFYHSYIGKSPNAVLDELILELISYQE